MWLDKEELFSNKKPHIVVLFRNKGASGAGDILDDDGQLNTSRLSNLWWNKVGSFVVELVWNKLSTCANCSENLTKIHKKVCASRKNTAARCYSLRTGS